MQFVLSNFLKRFKKNIIIEVRDLDEQKLKMKNKHHALKRKGDKKPKRETCSGADC